MLSAYETSISGFDKRRFFLYHIGNLSSFDKQLSMQADRPHSLINPIV
jgi:hypothetical protein